MGKRKISAWAELLKSEHKRTGKSLTLTKILYNVKCFFC